MNETPQFLNVRKHMVHIPSMPAPLRILVGLGVAQIVVGVLMVLFKGVEFPSVLVARQGEADLEMGLPFLFVATLILIVAWTYVLTGALRIRWWASFPILATTTVVTWQTMASSAAWPIGPLAMAAIWIYFLLRKTRFQGARLRTDLLVVVSLVTALNLAVVIISLAHGGAGLWEYPVSVAFQVAGLIGLLIPMLVVAGIDMTEVALESSAWVTDRLAALVPPTTYAVGLIMLAVAKVAIHIAEGSGFSPGLLAALGIALGLALLSYLLRNGAAQHHEPPFWLLLVLSCSLFLVPLVVLVVGQFLPPALARSFSETNMQLAWAMAGFAAAGVAVIAIVTPRLRGKQIGRPFLFVLIFGLWILITMGNPFALPQSGAPGSHIEVSVTIPQLDVATSIGVAVAVMALLAKHRLERRSLGFLAAVLFAVSVLSGVNSLYEQEYSFGDLLVLLQLGAFLVVPVIKLVSAIRNRHTPEATRWIYTVVLSAIALVCLAAVLLLLGAALHMLPSGFALPQESAGIIILALALLWDFVMSGGRFTNQHGVRFPREGRLLLYVGYVSLTAAVLLWTKTLQTGSDGFFDENLLPRYGLVILGIPMIFYLWAQSGGHLWLDREAVEVVA